MKNFYKFMGSGFGVGWLPVAPGTWGATVAILPLFFFTKTGPSVFPSFHTLFTLILTVLIVIFTWIGVKAADSLHDEWGDDPKQIVIDEMIGVSAFLILQSLWVSVNWRKSRAVGVLC
jgi:phosphatidylglycerophosphatase A